MYSFDRKLDALVHDVQALGASDAQTAQLIMTTLDAYVAHDRDDWPRALWKMDGERELAFMKDRALAAGIYPATEELALERLASETKPPTLALLAHVVPGDDPRVSAPAAKAAKRLVEATDAGKTKAPRDHALTLLLAALAKHDPARAAEIGYDALGGGWANDGAALAVANAKHACAAATTLLSKWHADEPRWLEERCAKGANVTFAPSLAAVRSESGKRKALRDTDYSAHPLVPIGLAQDALVAVACSKRR